jgi:hypothetical protein
VVLCLLIFHSNNVIFSVPGTILRIRRLMSSPYSQGIQLVRRLAIVAQGSKPCLGSLYWMSGMYQVLYMVQYLFFRGEGSSGAWTQGLYIEPLHQPFFVMGFFEIESRELFALAGFELQSFWSLPLGS